VQCKATRFAVVATDQNEAGRAACLIGHSHGELGRFTAHSPPLGSDVMS